MNLLWVAIGIGILFFAALLLAGYALVRRADALERLAAEAGGNALLPPPPTTALGALLGHITGGADAASYQPMNVNFGLFPPLDVGRTKKADRKKLYTDRAKADLEAWLA